jgi:FkbM family methyltransferase
MTQMWGVKDKIRRGRHFIRVLTGHDLYTPVQLRCTTASLGNDNANWCICPAELSEESVVYSFGVGTDVSFDLEMIRRFGVRLQAFDPTPRAIAWVRCQALPEEFVFHDYGVGAHDGNAVFHPPESADFVSYSIFERGSSEAVVEAPVYRLATIMKTLGHEKIDVLKMDIEGAEYDVLSDLLASNVCVRQLLVEFHHCWKDVGLQRTREAIQSLQRAGYRIFHVSSRGVECPSSALMRAAGVQV